LIRRPRSRRTARCKTLPSARLPRGSRFIRRACATKCPTRAPSSRLAATAWPLRVPATSRTAANGSPAAVAASRNRTSTRSTLAARTFARPHARHRRARTLIHRRPTSRAKRRPQRQLLRTRKTFHAVILHNFATPRPAFSPRQIPQPQPTHHEAAPTTCSGHLYLGHLPLLSLSPLRRHSGRSDESHPRSSTHPQIDRMLTQHRESAPVGSGTPSTRNCS